MKRLLLLAFALLVLVPTTAAAQTWTLNLSSGVAVMNKISILNFTVQNTGATRRINRVELQLPQKDYDIEGAVPPSGWTVSAIDKLSRVATFTANTICGGGLAPGASANFGMRVVGAQANGDVTGEDLTYSGKKTQAYDDCAPAATLTLSSHNTIWTRVGLDGSLTASPRSLDLGGSVTVVMTITNVSSANHSGITPLLPTSSLFGLTGPGTPATLTLASGATGTIQYTYATYGTRGVTSFHSGGASDFGANNASTGPLDSLEVSVGMFTGSVSLSPVYVTNGESVSVSLTVSNNTADPMSAISPLPPTVLGTASAALLSGPSPTTVSLLSPGASTRFNWVYSVSGPPGDTYQFQAQAQCTRSDGSALGTDPVGSAMGYIVAQTIRANPNAIVSGAAGAPTTNIAYTVFNGGTLNVTKVSLLDSGSQFPMAAAWHGADTSGWTATLGNGNPKTYDFTNTASPLLPGQSKTFTLTYGAVGTVTTNITYTHRAILTQSDTTTVRVEAPVTLFVSRVMPDPTGLVAISGPNRNSLVWNNPSDHDGTLVLQASGATPNTPPVVGRQYVAGNTLGNATVVYVDSQSFGSAFASTGLTNGTRYYYKVFNHDEFWNWSPGNVPSSAGVFSEPTSRVSPSPLWASSTGIASAVQPVTDPGSAIFSANNGGTLSANLTSSNPAVDGSERWRAVTLGGAVQSRFKVVPLLGQPASKYIIVGDQKSYGYAINAATGSIAWKIGQVTLTGGFQAPPAVQINSASNAAFQSASPGSDLVFFATRDAGTNNGVWAISGATGLIKWSKRPGNMNMVNGGMAVDYANNYLFVPSASGGGAGPSLWVFDTTNGAVVKSFSFGDVRNAVNIEFASNQLVLITDLGVVHFVDIATLTELWPSYTVGPTNSYVFPVANGFIASLASGAVQRYVIDPTTHVPAPVWSPPPAVPTPSGVWIDYTSQYIYVGDGTGKLHQISTTTGAEPVPAIQLGTGGLSTPTIDTSTTPRRLHVNSVDGRLTSLAVPF